jgi:hypothetical protein
MAVLIPAAAFAQTNTPTANPPETNTTPSHVTAGRFLTQVESGQWRTFKLIGLNVYNINNEHIGDIRELLQEPLANAGGMPYGLFVGSHFTGAAG